MPRNEQAVLDMLDEIDRARLGVLSLDELEEKLWRLLDQTDESFPPVLSGRVEDFVLELKRLQAENLAIFDRCAGMLALAAGDNEAARLSFAAARTSPHVRWCADYHLAGLELQQLAACDR